MSERGQKSGVSNGVLILAILIAFVAGNRLTMVGDWFFSPYTNKGSQTLSQSLDYTETKKVYDVLKRNFDGKLDMTKLNEGLSRGLLEATGDPYTVYMSAKEAEEFEGDLNGSFSGIGAELGKKDGNLVIIAPLDGSPAKKAGVRAGDVILKVNDEDSTQFSVEKAVSKIRGEAGTEVKLLLGRESGPAEIKITRAQISVPSVKSEILDGNIGYLQLSRFDEHTAELARNAANDFKAKNVNGIILDLRNNGGGVLDASVDVAGLWMNNKVVVSEREGERVKQEHRTNNNAVLEGVKTVVLINNGSASASEILAGALKDNGAATLLGEKTFGKGSVQQLIDLDGGAKLKVTVAHWYTPKGVNVSKEGIKPDEEVKQTTDDFNNNRDPQKDKALEQLK